jgi:hypothetical protein
MQSGARRVFSDRALRVRGSGRAREGGNMVGVLRIEEASTALGFRLSGPHGSVEVTEVGRGVVLLDYEGIAYAHFCERIGQALEAVMERNGEITVFTDASRMRSYETEFRRRWSVWLQVNRDSIRSCVVLVHSPVVRMWIDIVNVVTGGMIYGVESRQLLRRLMREAIFEGDPDVAPSSASARAAMTL